MIELKQVRADTPYCNDFIHFNNAGAAMMPAPVFNAVQLMQQNEYEIGGYEAAEAAEGELSQFYSEFAQLLNASEDEIAYVENATRAWDMAFYGLDLNLGDRIIVHQSEYASNYLAYLQQSQKHGFHIDIAPSDPSGQVDVAALAKLIGPRTKLISICHIPTQGGLVNPVEEIGKIARQYGVLFLLDACQSVGQLEVDVDLIGCDILTGTGRKYLRGPRGTGFLYVRKSVLGKITPPFIDLHSARWTGKNSFEFVEGAKRFENWECNVAGKIGLMRAARYARETGMKSIEVRILELGTTLRNQLSSISGISLHDRGEKKCGLVTFTKEGVEPNEVARRLRASKMNVSVSTSPYALLDLGVRGLDAVVRASLHYYNTDEEISRFVDVVKRL